VAVAALLLAATALAVAEAADGEVVTVPRGAEQAEVEESVAVAVADPLGERLAGDPVGLIGLTLPEAYKALGAPSEVFSYRGTEGWQDDVVFYYPGSAYLFWYRSRVWQVRVDARYTGSFHGLRMGDPRERVIQAVARPYQDVDGSLVFHLKDASLIDGPDGRGKGVYPLRLRTFFRDNKLADAYLYRGDF
jgi:hypothetical protein